MVYLLYNPIECDWKDEYEFDSLLPEERKRKALRYVRYSDRLLSRKAYFLLCYAVSREYGVSSFPQLAFREDNKPCFKEFPNIKFSFSHCSGGILCSVSEYETGADIESAELYAGQPIDGILSEICLLYTSRCV